MLVSEIGEFALIRILAKEIGVEYPPQRGAPAPSGLLVGLGDDAVVTQRRDGALVWTTDTLVDGVHVSPTQTAWRDIGWKALCVNLSDIAAMGAEPHLALITLMLPPSFCVEDAIKLYRGLNEAAQAYGVILGGGDIVRAPVFAITVALSGWAYASRLGQPRVMTRGTARAGDVVAVSGHPGDSAGGLALLQAGSDFTKSEEQLLREAHERPQPRVDLGRAAVRTGIRCAIDVSDGLIQDLGHIARATNVGIRIDAERVPLSKELTTVFPSQALEYALTGGEDYELLLIGPKPAIERLISETDVSLTIIGEVVEEEQPHVAVFAESGQEITLDRAGWDHFAQ